MSGSAREEEGRCFATEFDIEKKENTLFHQRPREVCDKEKKWNPRSSGWMFSSLSPTSAFVEGVKRGGMN